MEDAAAAVIHPQQNSLLEIQFMHIPFYYCSLHHIFYGSKLKRSSIPYLWSNQWKPFLVKPKNAECETDQQRNRLIKNQLSKLTLLNCSNSNHLRKL